MATKARVVLAVSDLKPTDIEDAKPITPKLAQWLKRPIRQFCLNFTSLKQLSLRSEKPEAGALSYWPQSAGPFQVFAFLMLLVFSFVVLDPLVVPFIRSLPPEVSSIFTVITEFATAKVYLVPVGVVALILLLCTWHGMHRRLQWRMLQFSVWLTTAILAIGVGGLLVNLLKRMIGRGRPKTFDELGAYGFDPFAFTSSFASFPSGHATTTGSVVMLALIFLPRWRIPLMAIAIILAASRVVLGSHYVSDVLLGLCLGALFARMVCVYFVKRGLGFYENRTAFTGFCPIFLKFDIMKDRKEIGGAFTATFNRGLPQSDNLSIKPENHQKD